tara:strand:- start:124 stop:375 length:252 start_codon:yes stop_codon:yes gene_type:complete
MVVVASAVHVLLMDILALMEVVMSAVVMVVLILRFVGQSLRPDILAWMEVVIYAQVILLKVHVDAFRVAFARLNLLPVIPIVQ